MDDGKLFKLLCSEDPARFQDLSAEIGDRLNVMANVMIATARKRASDLDPREVAQEVATKATETLFDQFLGEEVGFRFDPTLAPFDAWIFSIMGGAKTRGVIDSMRATRKREKMRLQNIDSEETLDRIMQEHHSGARWQHGGGAASILQTTSVDSVEEFDARDLLATLSPRENLILRWEVGLDGLDRMEAHEFRHILNDCGFTDDEQSAMVRRALTEGGRGQDRLARLLGVSTRTIRKLKASACVKLKQRFVDGEWSRRDRNTG